MILVCGDTHWRAARSRLEDQIWRLSPGVELVLHCGDFGYWPGTFDDLDPFSVPVHFCDGNHENHKALRALRDGGPPRGHEIVRNGFWQDRGSTITLPDGRVVLFAGGALSEEGVKDHYQDLEQITGEDLARFPDCHVDIVISHTCPSRFAMDIHRDYYGEAKPGDPCRAVLDKIFERYRPSLWYFGHWHLFQEGEVDGCRWQAVGCMYRSKDIRVLES